MPAETAQSRPKPHKKPTGWRQLTPSAATTEVLAERFTGLPPAISHFQVLAAFKAAAAALGWGMQVITAIDWLVSLTRPQDWRPGSRPIVWPSAAAQQERLGLGRSQTKELNRRLAELGLVVFRDSPNGKRWGRRDRSGRIVEAYGIDLSPLAVRMEEFQAIAARAREEREARAQLRRRLTIALRRLEQIVETAIELALPGEWERMGAEAARQVSRLRNLSSLEALALAVHRLEEQVKEGIQRINSTKSVSCDVETGPKGPVQRPHIHIYQESHRINPIHVEAQEQSKPTPTANPPAPKQPPLPPALNSGIVLPLPINERGKERPHPDRFPRIGITPERLARLTPQLEPYLPTPKPSWHDVVDAASWLCTDLGIGQTLWTEACQTLGRESAAVAIALLSTKPPSHFTKSRAAYLRGMLTRAKQGQLNLAGSLWKLRQQTCP